MIREVEWDGEDRSGLEIKDLSFLEDGDGQERSTYQLNGFKFFLGRSGMDRIGKQFKSTV